MANGQTTVSASKFAYAGGSTLIPAGSTVYFQPCDPTTGKPLPYRAGGDNEGQRSARPISVTLATAGQFSVVLDDTTQTQPENIGYLVTAVDPPGRQLLGSGFVIQPSGSTWNFDIFVADLGSLALKTAGPQGDKGDTGSQGATGPAGTTTQTGTTGGFTAQGNLRAVSLPEYARSTMKACVDANTSAFNDGTVAVKAGATYNYLFPSDAGIAIDAYPSHPIFSAANLAGMSGKLLLHKDGTTGAIPENISFDEATVGYFSSWDAAHHHPTGDGILHITIFFLHEYLLSGSTTHFAANSATIETALGLIPRDSSTGLVQVVKGDEWVPWAFQEYVRLTGLVTVASLQFWRSADHLVTLFGAAGNSAKVTYWQGIRDQIKASLQSTSALWDAATGMFWAATGQCKQHDVIGSAMAVHLGVASSAQRSAISDFFATNYATLFSQGYALQVHDPANSNSWNTVGQINSDGSYSNQSYGVGQYQSGFWSVVTRDICEALAVNHAALALQLATEQITGPDPMMEWYNNVGGIAVTATGAGSPNLESPLGAGSYLLAHAPSAATVQFSAGELNPFVVSGNYVRDAAMAIKHGSSTQGVREAVEAGPGQGVQRRLTVNGTGSLLIQYDSSGIATFALEPWKGAEITYFTIGPGGVGFPQPLVSALFVQKGTTKEVHAQMVGDVWFLYFVDSTTGAWTPFLSIGAGGVGFPQGIAGAIGQSDPHAGRFLSDAAGADYGFFYGSVHGAAGNTGALNIGYDSTNQCAFLSAISPTISWRPMVFRAKGFYFYNTANTFIAEITDAGELIVSGKKLVFGTGGAVTWTTA